MSAIAEVLGPLLCLQGGRKKVVKQRLCRRAGKVEWESREEGREGRKEGKRKGSDEGWEAPNILGLKVAVQLPKNSSSSFSATTCCDCTGWNEKRVKGEESERRGEEREGRREEGGRKGRRWSVDSN